MRTSELALKLHRALAACVCAQYGEFCRSLSGASLLGVRGFDEVAAFIRQHEVGRRAYIETPFGRRLIYYADQTATGRYLHFVEGWIRRVRPFYANTHTEVSSSGRIIGSLREKSRNVIHRSVGADPDDEVLFCGAGATSAVNKLVGLLGLRIPEPLERRYQLSKHIPQQERPVIFIGPYEHHSNELPWVETIAEVVEIGLDEHGAIDLVELEARLQDFPDRELKIGSFSAASNVTGVLTDVSAVARLLHQHGAYACFDYAASGPYVPIDMHPADPAERIDALYLSVHKFVGGPQASGILVVNRCFFKTRVPVRPGGGTVNYVSGASSDGIDYSQSLHDREEGGTPAVMSDVRAGTAFLVKEMIGAEAILEHEKKLAVQALRRLSAHPRISILGSCKLDRLSIIAFNIEGLHYDLVAGLLDHLFGIQNRAGCSCAGPYAHRLLKFGQQTWKELRGLILAGCGAIRPGWVRVTLPFYASADDIEFLLRAIEFVADHGRKLLPLYRMRWSSGVWRHIERPAPQIEPIQLTVDALEEAAQCFAAGDHESPISERELLAEREQYFAEAQHLVTQLEERWRRSPPQWNAPTGHEDVDRLCWFRYVHTDELAAAMASTTGKRPDL